MDLYSLIYITVFLVVCFGIYKLIKNIQAKKKDRPLWKPEDENNLKEALTRIYAATSVEELDNIFTAVVASYPQYHDLFKLAKDESYQKIMQTATVPFEVREKKVRKLWLIVWLLQCGVGLFGLILIAIALILMSHDPHPLSSSEQALAIIFLSTFFILIAAFITWVVYHCAYKKKGTRLLLLMLIMIPISWIGNLGDSNVPWFLLAANMLFGAFFWLVSYRLRQVNLEAKTRKQLEGLKAIMN